MPNITKDKNLGFRVFLFLTVVILMANLNALVDFVFHPQIPYLDQEHLLVGAAAAGFTAFLLAALYVYIRKLEKALQEVKTLEGMLPICSSCKKIRKDDNSWQPVDEYITQKTDALFTHGVCPECSKKLFGEAAGV